MFFNTGTLYIVDRLQDVFFSVAVAQNDWSFVAGFDASTTKKGIYIFWKHPNKEGATYFFEKHGAKKKQRPKNARCGFGWTVLLKASYVRQCAEECGFKQLGQALKLTSWKDVFSS